MFITDTRIDNLKAAIEIARTELQNEEHHILGVDTTASVCEYIVSWFGRDNQSKQARVNTASREWTPLTEHHLSKFCNCDEDY